MATRKPAKLPSRKDMRAMLAQEFKLAVIVPVRISKQLAASAADCTATAGVKTVTVRALIDSGCTKSVISPRALAKVGYKHVPKRLKGWVTSMVGALRIRGVANVFVEAEGGPELPLSLAVLDLQPLMVGGDFQMLLGLDYLRASMAKIDLVQGRVEFGLQMMPLPPLQPLHAQMLPGVPLEIPPGAGTIPGRLPEDWKLLPVEMTADEARVLNRLVGRFAVAQIRESVGLSRPEVPGNSIDPPAGGEETDGPGV